ncbi:MAG: HAMP domain-containing sensor histidine kinase [Bacteroidota bacterium]|nr:HAMP domain-containing sensor histidine kinase [Bacteroidota bacterium]
MKKKYIWLLTGIMTVTMIWLIVVQGRWIKNALLVKEQEFSQSVNKSLYRVVKKIEERETVLEITNQTVSYSSDSTMLQGRNFFENRGYYASDSLRSNVLVMDEDSDSYIGVQQKNDSIRNYRKYTKDELKQDIVSKMDQKSVFVENIINKLIRKEINIEERISQNLVRKLIEESFNLNGIDLPFEFAVKDTTNTYFMETKGFSLNFVKKTYETELFPNDIFSSSNYLVVYFSKDKSYISEEMPQPIITSIILTIIISLTFSLTIYIIYRQRKLSELKNDFISNMTHELKTPVATISLASQMLGDSNISIDKDRMSGVLNIIDDESKRLSFQIEKVLQTSLFEKGRIHMKKERLDIHEIIKISVVNMELRVSKKGGEIDMKLDADDFVFPLDEMHMTNVFFNLLDNAVKYSQEGEAPKIEISSENFKKGIRISVADNGIGISQEHKKRVFNKFYRIQSGNIHNVKGFGLGLNYVKRIVEVHFGRISVESNQGGGTVFKLFFPLRQENEDY